MDRGLLAALRRAVEDLSEDIFALDLGLLADSNPNVPAAYHDPEDFFRSSFLTSG